VGYGPKRSEETPSSVRMARCCEAQGETLGNGTETKLDSADVDDLADRLMTMLSPEMKRPTLAEQGQTFPDDHIRGRERVGRIVESHLKQKRGYGRHASSPIALELF